MILNVSDDGMAISMAIPVGDEAYSNLRVRMNGLPQSIVVHGRMAWTTNSKKRAGIQLVDVSEEQRGQIREWLAQEGVRDVNLVPRDSAASKLPPPSNAAVISRLADAPLPTFLPVAESAVVYAQVPADARVSLLTDLGGTAPEFLGPAQYEPSLAEDTIAETAGSPAPTCNFAGFRDNEWDLASITMVPRKRSKPEGLSAVGLLLLWIAIPSFGIGLIVGRRPLEQWLSGRDMPGKNVSHAAASEPEIFDAPEASPDITSSDIDASGPQPTSTRAAGISAISSSEDLKTLEATKSFVSTPAFVNTKLLNSMSTRELRAVKPAGAAAPSGKSNTNELSTATSRPKPSAVSRNSSSSAFADVKPVKAVPTPVKQVDAAPQQPDSKDKYPVIQAPARDTRSVEISDQGPLGASTGLRQSVNHSVAPISETAGNSVGASLPASDASRNDSATSNTSKSQLGSVSTLMTAGSGSVVQPRPGANGSIDATPRIAPDTRPSMASARTPGTTAKVSPSLYASSSSRSAAPSGASNLAPINARTPLHGVMLVARKTDESFLLRLPVESVAGGRSVSVEMQRFVMVPPESRWHRHGPIAKLSIGELLTQVNGSQLETASDARAADAITVRVFVDKNGAVQDIKPVSGRYALMSRVMHDVRDWQFDQTLIDGKPVESEINITVEYRGSGPQVRRSRETQAQYSYKP